MFQNMDLENNKRAEAKVAKARETIKKIKYLQLFVATPIIIVGLFIEFIIAYLGCLLTINLLAVYLINRSTIKEYKFHKRY